MAFSILEICIQSLRDWNDYFIVKFLRGGVCHHASSFVFCNLLGDQRDKIIYSLGQRTDIIAHQGLLKGGLYLNHERIDAPAEGACMYDNSCKASGKEKSCNEETAVAGNKGSGGI